jgi:hypothetical protein
METIKENSYEWILKVINSSVNPFHFDSCYKIIELYRNKWEEHTSADELEFILHEHIAKSNYF